MPFYRYNKIIHIEEDTNNFSFDVLELSQALQIYQQEALLKEGIDYILNSSNIQMIKSLIKDDELLVKSDISTYKTIISNNPRSTSTLFNKYKSIETLQQNTKYNININIKGKDFSSEFNSRYSPFYVSNACKIIRQDVGELSNMFSDKDINFAVYTNSLAFDENIVEKEMTGSSISDSMKTKWVRYKTCIELILNVYLSISSNSGSTKKKVGNLEFEKQSKIPRLKDMLMKFEGLFNSINNSIFSTTIAKNFSKSGSKEYPMDSRLW